MSQCSKCKGSFEEIDLIFIYENDKLILACEECKKNLDKKKETRYKKHLYAEEQEKTDH